MNSYKNNYIYWTLLTHKIGDFILPQLKMDYVSLDAQDENFEELNIWASKNCPNIY